jgi:hypothetical protein
MSKPFKGVIDVDTRDSTPDWEPYLQPIAPRRAERALYRPRRRRLLGDGAVGRADRHAQHQEARRAWPYVHELAHHCPVFADALVASQRPESHDQRDGLHR